MLWGLLVVLLFKYRREIAEAISPPKYDFAKALRDSIVIEKPKKPNLRLLVK